MNTNWDNMVILLSFLVEGIIKGWERSGSWLESIVICKDVLSEIFLINKWTQEFLNLWPNFAV